MVARVYLSAVGLTGQATKWDYIEVVLALPGAIGGAFKLGKTAVHWGKQGAAWAKSASSVGRTAAISGLALNSARRAAWRASFGKPSEGLGRVIRDLPRGHEARRDMARMIREIRASGGQVANRGLSGGNYAQFFPVGRTAVFQYQPGKLRIVDMLEERFHWQQIVAGQHLRSYGTQSIRTVLETLAKQRVLQHPQLSPVLRMEWLDDLARLRAGTY